MTRACARAIETEVNLLISELTHSTCETWLLPQAETLCVIRYLEEGHEATTTNGQDGEDTERKKQEEELPASYSHRTTGRYWTSSALKSSQPEGPAAERYNGWTIGKYRTSDTLQRPNNRQPPEIRRLQLPKRRNTDALRTVEPPDVRRSPEI
jgi:hypothetical protein